MHLQHVDFSIALTMTECYTVQPIHPTWFDDEMVALTLQLEEIGIYSQAGKGKHAVDRPPDSDLAYASFQAELQDYRTSLNDRQLAQSIGTAVYSDGAVVTELASEEIQCYEDRLLAFQISNNDPEYQKPSVLVDQETDSRIQSWMCTITESQYVGSVVDLSDDEIEAGPSMSYAERQADILNKLAKQFKCAVCHEYVYSQLTVLLPCDDRYCVDCLKDLFIRATKDETLFPVRCHKEPIPLELVSRHLSVEEFTAFERASVEYSTADRVYCSNRECGGFIPSERIELGIRRAVCGHCNTSTCGLCKNMYHPGADCPDDPALSQTRELAGEMGWQTCYRCRSIVILKSGCNHMT